MLYQTIVDFYLSQIEDGTILPGEKLPSLRKVSSQFDVSLSTAVEAFRRLELFGYTEVKDRSGYFAKLPTTDDVALKPLAGFKSKVVDLSHLDEIIELFNQSQNKEIAPFGIGVPEHGKLPLKLLNRNTIRALRLNPECNGIYIFNQGLKELRQELSRWIRPWAGITSFENIHITNGCLEAINIALSAECEPGDIVAIESPCYFGLLHAIHHHKLKALEVRTDPSEGLNPEAFEILARTHKIKALVTSANGQNPMGFTMSDERKKEILGICFKYGIRLIEDDLYGELCFERIRPKTYKYFDKDSIVTYCSSLSKFLGPGIRLGWCIPAGNSEKYLRQKLSLNLSTSSLSQYLVYHLLKNENVTLASRVLAGYYQKNIQIYSSVMQNQLGSRIHLTKPSGSFFLWAKVDKLKSLAAFEKARRHKILFTPGPLLSATRQYDSYIRINCAHEFNDARNQQLIKLCGILKSE